MSDHLAEVWREKRWPYQWIGQCRSCRQGTRCNDRATAVAFLQGHHPTVIQPHPRSAPTPSPESKESPR